jgi:hypothetical protein
MGLPMKTRQIRVNSDLHFKIIALCHFEHIEAAEYLDPVLRKLIERRFSTLPAVYRAKVLRAAALQTASE